MKGHANENGNPITLRAAIDAHGHRPVITGGGPKPFHRSGKTETARGRQRGKSQYVLFRRLAKRMAQLINIHFGFWDMLLLVAVSLHVTLFAYVRNPYWKALLLVVPTNQPLIMMAVGRPVDATNVAGLVNLILFTHVVRFLHQHGRVPIVISIGLGTLIYCLVGVVTAPLISPGEIAFWTISVLTLGLAATLHFTVPSRSEPGHRTSLKIWIKIPMIITLVSALIGAKKVLAGFATAFPIVSILACYEGRHCLWTMTRQIPDFALLALAMLALGRLTQAPLGLGGSQALAFAFGIILVCPTFYRAYRKTPMIEPMEENHAKHRARSGCDARLLPSQIKEID